MPKSDVPELKATLVGARVLRTEDPRYLTGRGRYVADLTMAGTAHLAIARSPLAHALVRRIETSRAMGAPGVLAVWTGTDTTGRCPGIRAGYSIEGMKSTTQPILANGTVRYVGEAAAAVVATSRAEAEDACELLEIDYDPLPAVLDPLAARTSPPIANVALEDNLILRGVHAHGDVDAALRRAFLRVRGTFANNRCAAAPLETRGCLATYDWTTSDLTLWSSTQMPHFIRSMIAAFAGLPEHHLQVIAPDVGGGFGQKAHLFPEEVLVCLLAKELGRPIRWVEDRRENLLAATHAKDQVNEMEIGVDADGRILALEHHSIGDGGAYNCFPWTHLIEAMASTGQTTSVYAVPAIRTTFEAVVTNKCPVGAYRGIGWTAGQIARESLLDQAARALGLSPFEIRRRNVVPPDAFPYTAATGLTFHEGSYLETVDALEAAVDYDAFATAQRAAREEGRYLGLGLSIFNEVNGMGTRACVETGFLATTHDTSTVRLEPSGKLRVTTSVVSQGQGHQTTLGQVAADAFGLPLSDVVVVAGDTGQTFGLGTWGSRGAVIGAGSILRAADAVRERVLTLAAHLFEVSPEDLVLENGIVHVAGSPDRAMSLGDVARTMYFAEQTHPEGFDPTAEATATYDPSHAVFSNGGHAVVAEVDVDTGLVRLERVIAVEDCGTVINPMIVEGQLRGGVAQAVGAALLEEVVYSDDGQPLASTFMDYLLPTSMEVPDVEVIHLATPSKFTPAGIKGMGESSMISVPAAIVNAVNDALAPLGVFLDRCPLSPDRILTALLDR